MIINEMNDLLHHTMNGHGQSGLQIYTNPTQMLPNTLLHLAKKGFNVTTFKMIFLDDNINNGSYKL